jgi:hypothetical protein
MKPRRVTIEAPTQLPDSPMRSQLHAIQDREASTTSAIWEPIVVLRPTPSAPVTIPIEGEMVSILERPIAANEGHRVGMDRKEVELRELFATLAPVEALWLRRRLDAQRPGDALAKVWTRLVVERRQRLLVFLDNTRRRLALGTR